MDPADRVVEYGHGFGRARLAGAVANGPHFIWPRALLWVQRVRCGAAELSRPARRLPPRHHICHDVGVTGLGTRLPCASLSGDFLCPADDGILDDSLRRPGKDRTVWQHGRTQYSTAYFFRLCTTRRGRADLFVPVRAGHRLLFNAWCPVLPALDPRPDDDGSAGKRDPGRVPRLLG